MKTKQKPAFTVIYYKDDTEHTCLVFLVRERKSLEYMLPGGGIEHGESAYDAAIRELREESGFKTSKYARSDLEMDETERPGDFGASFFLGTFPFPFYTQETIDRIFSSRTDPRETDGWALLKIKRKADGTYDEDLIDINGNSISAVLKDGTFEGLQILKKIILSKIWRGGKKHKRTKKIRKKKTKRTRRTKKRKTKKKRR